ncbi:MAG: response regulator [Flavobacteriales bacterium]|nr:response regulator [Flavobacteriales bacterium]
MNRAFYQTFKVTPAETGNSLLYKVGNGQWDILELRTLLEEILPQHTEVHGFEVVHVFEHIGKKTMLLNARRLVQATDQAPLILLAIEDITERKRLEDELHQVATEIHEYTASIVATVREPLLVLDADLRVQSASRSFYENFRVTPEGTENRLLYDLGNRQWDIPALRRLLEEVLPQENQVNDFSVEHEFEHIGKKTMLLNARRLIRATDQTPLILLAIEDITERSRLEDELRQIAAAMSEADRRKNEFLALLAHELRNPLAPIRSAVQLMQLTNDPEANKAATGIVERQVDQMVRLVDDLLDVSRISRGKIELRKQRIDLASIVKQAVEDTRPLVTSMGHELTVTIPPEPVFLNADRTRLIQVLGNLLNNACKFTDMGGRISLVVEVVGGDVVISVRDNGIGIAAAQLPSIFEMFVQADTSMERSVSGLGIGLALVKNMVEMHGGTVEVHSDGLGRGSTFVVRMAIMESPALAPALGAVDGGPDLATAQRILVVDDNVDAALMLERLLQLNGKQTRVAHSGPDALEVAEQFRPHLILLDIGLPKLNGYEVCRRIRRQPWGKDMVVIALTGWGQEEDRKRSKEAGFNAHFVKPLEREALMLVLAGKYPAAA